MANAEQPKPGEPFRTWRAFTEFFRIPCGLAEATGISARAKLAYGCLVNHAGEDGNCFVSVGKIAAEIGGIDPRQARACLEELERAKLIRREFHDGTTSTIVFLWSELFAVKPRKKISGVPRKKTSALPGEKLPDTPEENLRTPRKKTSAKKNQLKENVKESSSKGVLADASPVQAQGEPTDDLSHSQTRSHPSEAEIEAAIEALHRARVEGPGCPAPNAAERGRVQRPDRRITLEILRYFDSSEHFNYWLRGTVERRLGQKARQAGYALWRHDAEQNSAEARKVLRLMYGTCA
jgi:hypothetical protein